MDDEFYKQSTLPQFQAEETPLPPLPKKIGPYKIESLLSKGSMSLLYLGLHPQTKQPLVIKVLSPQFVNHPEAVERFLKEAQIIALTLHPNIVKLFGQGAREEGLYIAMELIRGVSLRQFIAQESLSLKRTLDIILQVAYALLHLHTHGVVHRDLKPENILITEEGEIKVIDFGIAQLHEETKGEIENKQVMGTPNYMSPEQKEDPSKVTYSSDIYSLGIIAYELILGKLSFGIIDPSLLPKGLRKIIEKALAISIKERYQDVVDFITDISSYLKSGQLDKDRSGSDQLKELIENFQKTAAYLSPLTPPQWEEIDVGTSKAKGLGQLGLYFDFFRLPRSTFLIALANPTKSMSIDSPIFVAGLRGAVRTLVQEQLAAEKSLDPTAIASKLQQLTLQDPLGQHFDLSLLLLSTEQSQLTFLSCGFGALLHLPQGSASTRLLAASNPPLGSSSQSGWTVITDNWNAGDTLVLHTFNAPALEKNIEADLQKALEENALLSPQPQAEALLKKASSTPAYTAQKGGKMLITLQRIS